MNKNVLAIIISVLIVGFVIFYIAVIEDNGSANLTGNGEMTELIDCLAENKVVIYGSKGCPACTQLARSFGGYEAIESIYVECSTGTAEERRKCTEEMQSNFVPEIQIEDEVYEGNKDPASLAEAVNCEF